MKPLYLSYVHCLCLFYYLLVTKMSVTVPSILCTALGLRPRTVSKTSGTVLTNTDLFLLLKTFMHTKIQWLYQLISILQSSLSISIPEKRAEDECLSLVLSPQNITSSLSFKKREGIKSRTCAIGPMVARHLNEFCVSILITENIRGAF